MREGGRFGDKLYGPNTKTANLDFGQTGGWEEKSSNENPKILDCRGVNLITYLSCLTAVGEC